MNLSKLISTLQNIQSQYGDLDIAIVDNETGNDCPISSVEKAEESVLLSYKGECDPHASLINKEKQK